MQTAAPSIAVQLTIKCASLQMQTGMDKANASDILMLPTYVVKLPTG